MSGTAAGTVRKVTTGQSYINNKLFTASSAAERKLCANADWLSKGNAALGDGVLKGISQAVTDIWNQSMSASPIGKLFPEPGKKSGPGIGNTVMEITERVIKEQESKEKASWGEGLAGVSDYFGQDRLTEGQMGEIANSDKIIKVNEWLNLHTTKSSDNGRKVEISNLDQKYPVKLDSGEIMYTTPKRFWYSFGGDKGVEELGKNAILFDLNVVEGAHGEQVDDAGRQYIYIGPRVLNPDYPDAGKLGSEEFKFGTKIDIKLKDRETGEESYLYASVGGIRGHTYGEIGQGIIHSGIPYPNSANAAQGNADANYSTVEFMRTSEGTGLSDYIIVELYVYDK